MDKGNIQMKSFRKFIESYEEINEAELNLEWWNSKSPAYQKRYLDRHPNSIYAQKVKSGELSVASSDTSEAPKQNDTAKTTEQPSQPDDKKPMYSEKTEMGPAYAEIMNIFLPDNVKTGDWYTDRDRFNRNLKTKRVTPELFDNILSSNNDKILSPFIHNKYLTQKQQEDLLVKLFNMPTHKEPQFKGDISGSTDAWGATKEALGNPDIPIQFKTDLLTSDSPNAKKYLNEVLDRWYVIDPDRKNYSNYDDWLWYKEREYGEYRMAKYAIQHWMDYYKPEWKNKYK